MIADQTAAERELEVVDIRDTEPDATEHTDPVERRRCRFPTRTPAASSSPAGPMKPSNPTTAPPGRTGAKTTT